MKQILKTSQSPTKWYKYILPTRLQNVPLLCNNKHRMHSYKSMTHICVITRCRKQHIAFIMFTQRLPVSTKKKKIRKKNCNRLVQTSKYISPRKTNSLYTLIAYDSYNYFAQCEKDECHLLIRQIIKKYLLL